MRKPIASFITLAVAVSSHGRIITVDDDNPADFTTIRAAINDANDGDTVEIQPGTYTGEGNKDIDFLGKAIIVRSTDPSDPCTVAGTIIECSYPYYRGFMFQMNEDANSVLDGLTVTKGRPGITITDSAPTIMNCTVTGGSPGVSIANSAPTIRNCMMTGNGPAIHCDPNGNPTITGCLFTDNHGNWNGGAIYFGGSSGTVSHCIFRENEAYNGRGGAVAVYYTSGQPDIRSNVKFNDCLFADCSAEIGGGLRIVESDATVTNCRFERCTALRGMALAAGVGDVILTNCQFIGNRHPRPYTGHDPYGGALHSIYCNVKLTNCLFAGNHASRYGYQVGALCVGNSDVLIKNSTFADDYSLEGNTLVVESWDRAQGYPSEIRIEDSVIWDGPESMVVDDESVLLVTFSDVQGTVPGYGNIDVDPWFADPGYWVDSRDPNIVVDPNHYYASWVHGDYHLKSQGGRWDTNEGRWVTDDVTSSCIDAGDPNSPIGPEPFPNGGLVNMGAYGGTDEASKSYFGTPPCEVIVAGDINGDCMVDFLDLSLMGAHWLGKPVCPDMPTEPNPADNGEEVPLTQILTWRPSCNATAYEVYFGEDSPPQYRGQQETLTFDPGTLDYNRTYYWHIKEITPGGTIIGPTWSFETLFRLDPATNPNPPDGTPSTAPGLELRWTPGFGAESHDVYFGQTNPPEFQINQTSARYDTGLLSEETTYYWRIDEVNSKGKTTGTVWSFTTGTGGTR